MFDFPTRKESHSAFRRLSYDGRPHEELFRFRFRANKVDAPV